MTRTDALAVTSRLRTNQEQLAERFGTEDQEPQIAAKAARWPFGEAEPKRQATQTGKRFRGPHPRTPCSTLDSVLGTEVLLLRISPQSLPPEPGSPELTSAMRGFPSLLDTLFCFSPASSPSSPASLTFTTILRRTP